jgi:hypothetical protein
MKKYTMLTTVAVFAMMLVGATALAQDHEYVGAEKCKMCHKIQYNSWLETTHAKATEHAKASTDRPFEASCLKCHATNSTEDLPGVQCEACHGAGSDFKKMSIMKDIEAAKANGLQVPDQATCDGCHVGDDHSTAKVFADEVNNKAAVHEFKNPPGE